MKKKKKFCPISPFWYGFWSVNASMGYALTGRHMPTYEEYVELQRRQWEKKGVDRA